MHHRILPLSVCLENCLRFIVLSQKYFLSFPFLSCSKCFHRLSLLAFDIELFATLPCFSFLHLLGIFIYMLYVYDLKKIVTKQISFIILGMASNIIFYQTFLKVFL